jgi:hypothetical protein
VIKIYAIGKFCRQVGKLNVMKWHVIKWFKILTSAFAMNYKQLMKQVGHRSECAIDEFVDGKAYLKICFVSINTGSRGLLSKSKALLNLKETVPVKTPNYRQNSF